VPHEAPARSGGVGAPSKVSDRTLA
jgi:hypothetical protein